MSDVTTLSQRKQARAEEIRAGFESMRAKLADYGRTHGGRFWIYGSAASGRFHFESDIDILTDFAPDDTTPAIRFVEATGAALRLQVDVQPKAWCTPAFLEKISATALVLP